MVEQYSHPGVHTKKLAPETPPPSATGSAALALVGVTLEGPVEEPTRITSWAAFKETFGSFTTLGLLPHIIYSYFANGGSRAIIVRVLGTGWAKSAATLGTEFTFTALNDGKWGDDLRVTVLGDDDFFSYATQKFTKFVLRVLRKNADSVYEVVEEYRALDLDTSTDPDYILDVVNSSDGGSAYIKVTEAASPGIPATLAGVAVEDEKYTGDGTNDQITQQLGGGGNIKVGATTVEVTYTTAGGDKTATDDGNGELVGDDLDPAGNNTVDYTTGVVKFKPTTAIENGADKVVYDYVKPPAAASIDTDLTSGANGVAPTRALTSEKNGTNTLETNRKGMYALDNIDDNFDLALPDFAGTVLVATDMVNFCKARRNAFAILSTKEAGTVAQALNYRQVILGAIDNEHGALYYPWVEVKDPESGRPKLLPPCGHVAGVYSRTDQTRNVGKVPAGRDDGRLNFSLGLERIVTNTDMGKLNAAGVNTLWENAALGRTVFGGRTLRKKRSDVRAYVNAPRTINFLSTYLFATSWGHVFENNGPALRSKVRQETVSAIDRFYKQGMFKGATPDEAYFVTCDSSNNTKATEDAGQVICDVGVAINRPGEFIIFRLRQLAR